MLELYQKLPKESFELILRNISVREYLRKIWDRYATTGQFLEEDFEKIFDELFRFFFRPFEALIFYEKIVGNIIPFQEILMTGKDVFSAYTEFLESLASHTRLTFQLFSEPFIGQKMPLEKFLEEWNEFLRRSEIEAEIAIQDYPFALPENAKKFLFDCIYRWNDFLSDYKKYRDLLRAAYKRAVEKTIEFGNKNPFRSFGEFKNSLQDFLASEFNFTLKSPEYLEIQGKLFSALFDHLYCLRRFLELLIESNPASPFATVSQIDEAYKRIMELKRKITELERKIEKLGGEK
ncbi:MAG: hypothetical protein QXN34_02455 [Archaeoglobaceae archaeon]